MSVAAITIQLTYNLDEHYGTEGYKGLLEETIVDDLENRVYDDLIDLMRGDRLRSWAEYEVEIEGED
jgi:hypothetical protein